MSNKDNLDAAIRLRSTVQDEKVYAIQVGGDTLEEAAIDFMRMVAQTGEVSVQDSKGGKPYGKLLMAGGGLGGFAPSFEVEWPDGISIGGKVPKSAKLTVVFTDLQAPAARKTAQKSRAATIQGDINKLLEEARRLGVKVQHDPEANAAGEE